jgi:malate dehydrogenase (oxaloacetate-decarboxylating)
MLLRAADALAHVVTDEQLNANYIVPSVFDPTVVTAVATAVAGAVAQAADGEVNA